MRSDTLTVALTPSATTTVETARSVGIDALRVVLAVLVICLHGHVLADVDRRASYLMEQGLCRMAVPCFFIISGFYLERTDPRRFGGWLRHVLWLYLLWMALYAGFWWVDPIAFPLAFLARLAFGYYHLWFLVALAAAGSLMFALRGVASRRLAALAALCAVPGVAMQYLGAYHLLGGAIDYHLNQTNSFRNFLFFGFPFLAIGFLLSRHDRTIALSQAAVMRLLAAGLVVLMLESGLNLRLVGAGRPFDILLSLYIAAPALFLAARRVQIAGPGKEIALLATGMYLGHLAVLKALNQYTDLTQTPKVVLTVAISAALAAVLMRVNRRLPVL